MAACRSNSVPPTVVLEVELCPMKCSGVVVESVKKKVDILIFLEEGFLKNDKEEFN